MGLPLYMYAIVIVIAILFRAFYYDMLFLSLICLFPLSRVDLAQGYMSNDDLERAVKEFGQRCSNISRIYR